MAQGAELVLLFYCSLSDSISQGIGFDCHYSGGETPQSYCPFTPPRWNQSGSNFSV